MAAKAKKYTLKAVSGDGPKVCAFFSLPQGCRNGAKCPFVHDPNAAAPGEPPAAAPAPATPAAVTKNIQAMKQVKDEIARAQPAATSPAQPQEQRKQKRRRQQQQQQQQQRAPTPVEEGNTSSEDDEEQQTPAAPVAPPPRRQQQQQQQQAAAQTKGNKKKQQTPSGNPFLALAAPPRPAAAAAAAAPAAAATTKSRKPQAAAAAAGGGGGKKAAPTVQKTTTKSGGGAGGGGAGLLSKLAGLPVTPFSVARKAAAAAAAEEPAAEESSSESEEEEEEVVEAAPAAVAGNRKRRQPSSLVPPRPTETHGGSTWHGCVEATVGHGRFEGNYRVVLGSQKGVGEWIEPKKHGAWCKDLPHVVAIDCEMCATRDPVSMEQDGKALIRLSVVSGHDEEEVLLDTLVLPALPVIDYRSDIHGITPQDLREVQFTFRHAQAAMLQLCCSETVVIGHGLCNDLTALKMRHARVVDTALLFERADAPHHTPALKDVANAVLGVDLPDTHDSVADAQATLRVARHFLEQGPAAPVPRLPGPPGGKKARRGEALSACLLLHRLPAFVKAEHIADMFWARTHVKPTSVDPVAVTGGSGRTTARFLSKSHADLAFHTLTGPARPDKDGRPQKRVYLKDRSHYVQVRLMYTPGEEGENGGGAEVVEEVATAGQVKVVESVF